MRNNIFDLANKVFSPPKAEVDKANRILDEFLEQPKNDL